MTKLNEIEMMRWKRYHVPGCSATNRMKVNTIHLSVANSRAHELAKCSMAYDLMKNGEKILTEAVENETDLRRDLISLTSGEVFEFETNVKRASRHPKGINVVMVEK